MIVARVAIPYYTPYYNDRRTGSDRSRSGRGEVEAGAVLVDSSIHMRWIQVYIYGGFKYTVYAFKYTVYGGFQVYSLCFQVYSIWWISSIQYMAMLAAVLLTELASSGGRRDPSASNRPSQAGLSISTTYKY